jgi:GT2 family glycosyltransferase
MRIATIVCTVNRPTVLHETLLSVGRQSLEAAQILVATPGAEHVLEASRALPGVEVLYTAAGLAKQRNAALQHVRSEVELIAFLDDDVELSRYYFEEMARLFREKPEIVIASGHLLHDGGRGTRIEQPEARRLCEAYDAAYLPNQPIRDEPVDSGYGCNMVLRASALGSCRFDENLPLYAWLEDRDFSHRCTRGKHAPVELRNAAAVHLGWRTGRVSGKRLGFSTVVNPVYLMRKSKTFSMQHIFVHYWLRCLAGNVLGIVTRDSEYDRWGLLQGNLLGYWHLLSGKCDPQQILKM